MNKCPNCGLVNFSTAEECKRCGTLLCGTGQETFAVDPSVEGFETFAEEAEAEPKPRRSLMKRVLAGVLMALVLLFVFYISLLESSTPATFEQKQLIGRAIDHIERQGFTKDAFILRRLVNFRTSDNWWNAYVGHADAYAATNFPFEIVTLYPEFFKTPKDDTERALILLHEARHLAGAGEEEAFASVWRDRARLGYTSEKYFGTQVWSNVAENTLKYAPELFRCGPDGQTDCVELGLAAER